MGAWGTWRPAAEGRFFGDAAEVEVRLVGVGPREGRAGRALVVNRAVVGVLGWKVAVGETVREDGAQCSGWERMDGNG